MEEKTLSNNITISFNERENSFFIKIKLTETNSRMAHAHGLYVLDARNISSDKQQENQFEVCFLSCLSLPEIEPAPILPHDAHMTIRGPHYGWR